MPWTTSKLLAAIGDASPKECITEERMAELTGLTARQVENACDRLRRHGFISRTGKGCHKLTEAGLQAYADGAKLHSGPNGKHTGVRRCARGLRQRAWNALRLGQKFTIDDILMRACEGDERDAYSNVRKYIRALADGGYVRAMPQREQPLNAMSNGCFRWLLINDTGPVAPIWRVARKSLYDPNTETVVSIDPAHVKVAA